MSGIDERRNYQLFKGPDMTKFEVLQAYIIVANDLKEQVQLSKQHIDAMDYEKTCDNPRPNFLKNYDADVIEHKRLEEEYKQAVAAAQKQFDAITH